MSLIPIVRVTLNTTTYTNLPVTQTCSQIRISNPDFSASMTVRTDPNDSGTAREIAPQDSVTFGNAEGRQFVEGDVPLAAIIALGTGPAVMEQF